MFRVDCLFKLTINSPIDVPRFPNIDPFIGSFLKASTEDEMVKISKTTKVKDKTDLMDIIFGVGLKVFAVKTRDVSGWKCGN